MHWPRWRTSGALLASCGLVALLAASGGAASADSGASANARAATLRAIPGFGLKPTADIAGALAKPVAVRAGRVEVVITGFWAAPRSTKVDLDVQGTGAYDFGVPADAVLLASGQMLHESDKRFPMQAYDWGGDYGQLIFPALPAGTRRVTLSIPGTPSVRVALWLSLPSQLPTPAQFGVAVTAHGVTLAARAARLNGQELVEVVAEGLPVGTRFVGVGGAELEQGTAPLVAMNSLPQVATTGTGGCMSELVPGTPMRSTWGRDVAVTSVLLATYGKVVFRIPLPARGSTVLHLTRRVGPARVTVTGVRRRSATSATVVLQSAGSVRAASPGDVAFTQAAMPTRVSLSGRTMEIDLPVHASARFLELILSGVPLMASGLWQLPLGAR